MSKTPRDVDVTVIIATRNGKRILREVAACVLASMNAFGGKSELLLVDSASTDESSAIVREIAARDPRVTALTAPVKGLSIARNLGVAHAQGASILFTDDDVLVPASWVNDMHRALLEMDMVTGVVRLEEGIRSRLTRFQQELLADSEASMIGDPPRTIIGASMGFRRAVLPVPDPFEAQLGAGTARGFCEETLLHLQLTRCGRTTALVRTAVAEHHIDPSRISDEMFRGRVRQQAASEVWIGWHYLGIRPSCRDIYESGKANVRLGLQRLRPRVKGSTDDDLGRLRRACYLWIWLGEALRASKPIGDGRASQSPQA